MLAMGVFSEDVGVPKDPSACPTPAFCLLCLAIFRGLSTSELVFFRPEGGFVETFLLRTPRALRGPGLEATFLIPGGLPGFLLGGKALVLVSTISLSLGRGPRLSEIGTLSLCSSVSWISWGTIINGSTLGGPNLSAIGTRSRDRFIVVSPPI